MNLKAVNDKSLLASTEALVRQERELLTRVLHHLREIERRRPFSSLTLAAKVSPPLLLSPYRRKWLPPSHP